MGLGSAGPPAPACRRFWTPPSWGPLESISFVKGYSGGLVQRWHRLEARSGEPFASGGLVWGGHGRGIVLAAAVPSGDRPHPHSLHPQKLGPSPFYQPCLPVPASSTAVEIGLNLTLLSSQASVSSLAQCGQ